MKKIRNDVAKMLLQSCSLQEEINQQNLPDTCSEELEKTVTALTNLITALIRAEAGINLEVANDNK